MWVFNRISSVLMVCEMSEQSLCSFNHSTLYPLLANKLPHFKAFAQKSFPAGVRTTEWCFWEYSVIEIKLLIFDWSFENVITLPNL